MSKPERDSIAARGLQRVAMKKRRLFLIGTLAVCVPLTLMMGMQYYWLAKLKASSTLARSASKDQYLGFLSEKVSFYYGSLAEVLLDVPPDLMVGDREKLTLHLRQHFAKALKSGASYPGTEENKETSQPALAEEVEVLADANLDQVENRSDLVENQSDLVENRLDMVKKEKQAVEESEYGDAYRVSSGWEMKKQRKWADLSQTLRSVFVLSFEGPNAGELNYLDMAVRILKPSLNDTELQQNIYWASKYWQVRASEGAVLSDAGLVVDVRDARFPMVINPVTDEAGKLVGVVGMVVNPEYFSAEILPTLLSALETLLKGQKDWTVAVFDSSNELVLSKGKGAFAGFDDEARTGSLGFVFKDWRVKLGSQPSALEQLAGANMWLNLTLAGVLALSLLGGIGLTLRTAARELRLSEMKSDFVSNVSHELRTPLASIRVFGELLRHGRATSPEKVVEYGTYIESEGRRLSRLINNILDFSKIESNQKIYHFEKGDLEAVLRDVIATFEMQLQGEGAEVTFHGPPEPLPMIPIDSDALGQVFFNLLDNGIKYGNGNARVEVHLSREDGNAIIAFRDHGVGIARDELEKIFERFHRVSTGLVHDVKGSGLGLSIVRHVVLAHAGEVNVTSLPGKGSTFALTLPLAGPPQLDQQAEEEHT